MKAFHLEDTVELFIWPNFNIVVSHRIGRPKKSERDGRMARGAFRTLQVYTELFFFFSNTGFLTVMFLKWLYRT